MTWTNETKPRRRFPAKLAAGLAVSAMLSLGAFAAPAYADGDGDNNHREYRHNWNGGYYAAPPVVYGSPYGQSYYGGPYGQSYYSQPYYYPPPVVYGPDVGFSIQIR
jgi:hypothetical protein